jgi:hypothetical protein
VLGSTRNRLDVGAAATDGDEVTFRYKLVDGSYNRETGNAVTLRYMTR